ncbi:MAG: branched-chain amino acid ABC transporter permease [Pseudomonadota bacterium]
MAEVSATGLAGRLPKLSVTNMFMLASLVALALVPVIIYAAGNAFWLDIATRLVVLSMAAVSLNLILGFGGMVSFGHAAYLGIGAYCVGIPTYHALFGEFEIIASNNGFFHIALAVVISALFALIVGAICLRTKGVYFIMITMAFGQMVFYLFVSLEQYGADDGLVITSRSELPGIDTGNPLAFYFLCYASLLAVLYLVHRIVNSRFGMVIQGAKGNEDRMRSLGYSTYVYRLAAFVIAGAICGYAGALLGNFTSFISPEMMDWAASGELMFMVILGGASSVFGPVIGAAIFLLLEQLLSSFTVHWHLPFGIMLILIVLFVKGGVSGLLDRLGR